MKRYFLLILVVVVLLIGAYFAFFKDRNNYYLVVPEDARIVAELDVSELANECNVSALDLMDKYRSLSNSGIDFSKPIYGFVSRSGYIGIVAPVSNGVKFDSSIESFGYESHERRGFSWSSIGTFKVIHDDDKVLIMGPCSVSDEENVVEEMISLMKNKDNENSLIASFEDKDGFVKIAGSLDVFPEGMKSKIENAFLKGSILDKVNFSGCLKLGNRRLALSLGIDSDDERLMSSFNSFCEILQPISGELYSEDVDEPLIWVCCNLNGEKVLEVLRTSKDIRDKLLMLNMFVDADAMIRSIDGDVSISVPQLNIGAQEYVLKAELKNTDFLKLADTWGVEDQDLLSLEHLSKRDFYYYYDSQEGYFGVNANNRFYHTNSGKLAKNINNLRTIGTDAEFKKEMEGCRIFCSINLSRMLYVISPYVMMFGANQGVFGLINSLNRFNIKTYDGNNVIMELTLKDDLATMIL